MRKHDFDPLMRVSAVGPNAIPQVHQQIRLWLDSTSMQELIGAFRWTDDARAPLEPRLSQLVAQSDAWDFRRHSFSIPTTGAPGPVEAPRWASSGTELTQGQEAAALRAAEQFGLTNANLPQRSTYAAVLVLGGARLSCLLRTRHAAELLRSGIRARNIVLLGSERPIADSERDATDSFAPKAGTEFDLFVAAATQEMGITQERCNIQAQGGDRPHTSWEIRECEAEIETRVIIVSAPSSDPEQRRANSADTYAFYLERYGMNREDAFLLVTSQVYVPYQQLEALRVLNVPQHVRVETVGFPSTWAGSIQGMQSTHHFLQEIRSFLQSALRFVTTYGGNLPRHGLD